MGLDPLEIWVIAGLLIDEHGSSALEIAQQRAEKSLTENDSAGHETWCAVRQAAAIYLRSKPSENQHTH
jgi:hypothetical protein